MGKSSEYTRVSAAALAVIKIDGDYLMCLNKRKREKGIEEYSYFGGCLKFHNPARNFLSGLGAEFESGDDLRLKIPNSSLDDFMTWYNSGIDREVTVYRELLEEIVEEEKLLDDLDLDKCDIKPIREDIRNDYSEEYSKNNFTTYLINYYFVKFEPEVELNIKDSLKSHPSGRLILPDELEKRLTSDLIGINKFSLDHKNKFIM